MIKDIIKKYDLNSNFINDYDFVELVSSLNQVQMKNLLSLNIEPSLIKFDKELLINKDILNKEDYLDRINAIVNIDNADGWHHLFDRLFGKDFLDSPKFYQDIETLKRSESAQTPLWIIGNPIFINSPYHDVDFEKLVTAYDSSGDCAFLVQENIAKIAENKDSINSIHHEEDIDTILRYGSKSLQSPYSYPKASIGYLAVDPVSLKDEYHRENMEILAHNYRNHIGGYLYQIMTNKSAIKHRDYRRVIFDIIENKDNLNVAYILCAYLVGVDEADKGTNICIGNDPCFEIVRRGYNVFDLIRKVEEKYNIIDAKASVEEVELIEDNENIMTNSPVKDSLKQRIKKKFFKRK